jgi:Uma2 family endonuclease
MSTKTLMTVDQFLLLPDEELRRHELWQGELVEVGETIFNHNWIRDELVYCLRHFLRQRRAGGEVAAETGIQFDTQTLARPDVAYWDAEHLAAIDKDRSPVEIMPQLLAEVVSPSNSLSELFRKAEYFLRCGVQVIWIVDRDPFEIHVFEKGNAKRVVRLGEVLEAPSVLPGFSENTSRFVPPPEQPEPWNML